MSLRLLVALTVDEVVDECSGFHAAVAPHHARGRRSAEYPRVRRSEIGSDVVQLRTQPCARNLNDWPVGSLQSGMDAAKVTSVICEGLQRGVGHSDTGAMPGDVLEQL